MSSMEEKKEDKNKKVEGLSSEEAERRLKRYGHNEIPEKEESLAHRILRRFWNPISIMIETAALLSVIVHKWEDFAVILSPICLIVSELGPINLNPLRLHCSAKE
jgi:H+-transporting ATPase